jgi:hypothetical protein
MAFSAADWAIDYDAKTVTNDDAATGNNLPSVFGDKTHVGAILEFFQWLAGEFAAAGQMDDDYPIESQTPTVYRWLNGWTFGHANDYKYLEGGSIVDPAGSGSSFADSLWSNLYSIGTQPAGTMLYLIQNDAEVTPWWISGNVDILIKVKDTGSWIQSVNGAGSPTNGGVWIYARESGETYDHNFSDLSGGGRNPIGINTAIDSGNRSGDIYLTPAATTNFTVGSFVKGGTSLAVGKIVKIATGNLYLSAVRGGPFVISETLVEYTDRECKTAGDGSTTNSGSTAYTNVVAGYTDIQTVFVQRKFSGGTSDAAFTFGETITQTGTGATFRFVAEVSDELYVEDVSGSPNGTGQLTGGSSGSHYTPSSTAAEDAVSLSLYPGATAYPYNVVIDLNGKTTVQGYEWTKYLTRYKSVSPTYKLNGDDGQEYRACIEGTYAEVKVAPLGTLAGTTFYGARGVFVQNAATAAFVLNDADGTERLPPNYQRVICAHASLIGCQIFVAEIATGDVVKNQYTYDDTNSDATHLAVHEAIDINKTPLSGVIRVGDTRYVYTAFDTATKKFTVTTDPTGETDNADCYVPFLDVLADAATEQSDQIVCGAGAIDVRTVVRKYGFKPYSTDTQFLTTGLTFAPILVEDPQAT